MASWMFSRASCSSAAYEAQPGNPSTPGTQTLYPSSDFFKES